MDAMSLLASASSRCRRGSPRIPVRGRLLGCLGGRNIFSPCRPPQSWRCKPPGLAPVVVDSVTVGSSDPRVATTEN